MVTKLPGPEEFDKINISLLRQQCAAFKEKYRGDLLPILMLNEESMLFSALVASIATSALSPEEGSVVANINKNIQAVQQRTSSEIGALLREHNDDITHPEISFMLGYFINKYGESITALIDSASKEELNRYIAYWNGSEPPSASQFTMKSKESLN